MIRHWLHALRQGKLTTHTSRGESRKRRMAGRALPVEQLEGRQLLAVNPVSPPQLDPNSPLDTQLQLLLAAPQDEAVRSRLVFDDAGRVLVRVSAYNVSMAQQALKPLGFVEVGADAKYSIVEGYLPLAQAKKAGGLSAQGIGAVTALPKPILKAGAVQSQGDSVVRADRVRTFASAYDGAGVSIGVISDSYNARGGAAVDISNRELPNTVQVLRDRTGTTFTDEGRAMLQVVHDVAPGANLLFHAAGSSETELAAAIRALAAAGAKVIVDDIGFRTQAFYQDGPATAAINEVAAQGVTYFSAAGNNGNRSYQNVSIQTSTDSAGTTNGSFIDYDASAAIDTRQRIVIPNGGTIDLVLQWDDAFTSAGAGDSDLDMYLINAATGAVVASSINNNVRTGMPFEELSFNNAVAQTDYDLMILVRTTGSTPVTRLKWVDYGEDFRVALSDTSYNSGTVVGHTAATGAIAVGAVPYFDHLTPETFSSFGPVERLFDSGGTRLAAVETRQGAQIAAPDQINTTVTTIGADIALDADTQPNFSGTSAAAPHAAAIAALLLQANPSLTPTTLAQRLRTTAIDVGATGFDSQTGAGLVDAWRAIYGAGTPLTGTNTLAFNEGFNPTAVTPPQTPAPIALSTNWEVNTSGNGRVRIDTTASPDTGLGHLILDTQNVGSSGSLAAATLSVNMSRLTNAQLKFRQKEFADADNAMPSVFTGSSNSDGVAISFDGGTQWHRLISLVGAFSNDFYRSQSVDLNQFAASVGRQLTSNVKIRFQSFSSNPALGNGATPAVNTGGMAFDNIEVTGTYFNNAPTLTVFNRLSGAIENQPFTIAGTTLFANGNEADVDRDQLFYRIAQVKSGTVTINGSAWTGSELISPGDTVVWTPGIDQNGRIAAFSVVASDANKETTPPIDVLIDVTPVDSPPRFTKTLVLPNGQRNQPYSISYSLFTQYYEATDIDTPGPITYAINGVTSGRLTLNGIPVSPGIPFNPGDTLIWTPPSQVVSVADAFTVDAIGPSGDLAPTPAQVRILLPNTAPQMQIVGAIGGAVEDQPLSFDYDELQSKARATDADGDPIFFRVTAVTPGATLLVNNVPVVPGTTLIRRDDIVTFTPPANVNLTQVGFYVQATDGDLSSASPLPVLFDIQPVYDPPALKTPAPVIDVINGIARDFTFEELQSLTGAQTIDGVLSFRVTGVSTGVVTKNGAAVQPGVTTVGPGEKLRWSPPNGVFGLTNAFSIQASDGQTFSGAITISADITQTRFYRSYNPNAQYHFLTSNYLEFLAVVNRGLQDESSGRSGFAVGTRKIAGSTELFRLLNPSTGRHYYTENPGERDVLINIGWRYEKVEGYIFQSQIPGTVPIYRLYNQLSGTHLFTESQAVRDSILAQFPGAWQEHSRLGFAFPIAGDAAVSTSAPSGGRATEEAAGAVAPVAGGTDPNVVTRSTSTDQLPSLVAVAAPNVSTSVTPPENRPSAEVRVAPPRAAQAVDGFWSEVGRTLSDGLLEDAEELLSR